MTLKFKNPESNVWRLLPAADYCRASGNQVVEHSSDNETVLCSSRKLEGSEPPNKVTKPSYVTHIRSHARTFSCFAFILMNFQGKERLLVVYH